MIQYLLYYRWVFNTGNDLDGAPTLITGFYMIRPRRFVKYQPLL